MTTGRALGFCDGCFRMWRDSELTTHESLESWLHYSDSSLIVQIASSEDCLFLLCSNVEPTLLYLLSLSCLSWNNTVTTSEILGSYCLSLMALKTGPHCLLALTIIMVKSKTRLIFPACRGYFQCDCLKNAIFILEVQMLRIRFHVVFVQIPWFLLSVL